MKRQKMEKGLFSPVGLILTVIAILFFLTTDIQAFTIQDVEARHKEDISRSDCIVAGALLWDDGQGSWVPFVFYFNDTLEPATSHSVFAYVLSLEIPSRAGSSDWEAYGWKDFSCLETTVKSQKWIIQGAGSRTKIVKNWFKSQGITVTVQETTDNGAVILWSGKGLGCLIPVSDEAVAGGCTENIQQVLRFLITNESTFDVLCE